MPSEIRLAPRLTSSTITSTSSPTLTSLLGCRTRRVHDISDTSTSPPPPGHIGDVEKTIDAAEVDEGSVVSDVLHGAGEHHAFVEDLERVLLLLLALLLEHGAAGEHDVAAAPVELDDLGSDLLADHRGEILHRTQIDLRARQESLHAHLHGETTL